MKMSEVITTKDTALGTESIGKLLFKLSVPAIGAICEHALQHC